MAACLSRACKCTSMQWQPVQAEHEINAAAAQELVNHM